MAELARKNACTEPSMAMYSARKDKEWYAAVHAGSASLM
jgi:hypothetical protein